MMAVAQDWQHTYDASGNAAVRTVASANSPPQILGQPQTQIVQPGELASFSGVMADARGLNYQWRFNGANLPGSTRDTLLLANVSALNEGPYTLVVANNSGSVTSAPAMLLFDSDRDGLPDSWEIVSFGSITNQRSLGDFDGDGLSNLDEFRDGTNPTNSAAFRPRLTLAAIGSGFGEVTSVPLKRSYDLGELVTLSATPHEPSLFRDWTGSLNTVSNPVSLTMNTNKTMRGRFVAAVPPPPGLIALWRAETDASDTVGGHDGVFYSGTNVVAPSVTSTGMVGGAFSFDGAVHVRVPNSATLKPAQFTAEAWVYPTVQSGDFQTIISSGSSQGGVGPWFLQIVSGFPRFTFNAANSVEAPSQIPSNQWTHLAISFDGSTKRLYVNGLLAISFFFPAAFVYDATAPLTIGSDWRANASIYRFNGSVDEVALYDRALADSEIADIYYAEAAGRILDAPYFTSAAQMPLAYLGAGYTQQVAAVLGMSPISFELTGGALPPGMTLSPSAVVGGVPSAAGSYYFTLRATDAADVSTEQRATLVVVDRVTPPAGLVGWWRAESNALDSAGANHGMLSNGVMFAEGEVGQAFTFNGVNQSVIIPDAPALRPASVTLEAWVKLNTTVGRQYLFSKLVGFVNYESYALYLELPGGIVGRVGDITNFGTTISAGNLVTGRWYHVAYTFEGVFKQQFLYLDGVPIASGTGNKSIGYDAQPVLLGRDNFNGGPNFFFNGSLDEPAIYNRALSRAEIASIYQARTAGKSTAGPYLDAPSQLPDATAAQTYGFTFTSPRGTTPLAFALVSGQLPSGLILNSAGLLSGTPANSGNFNFVVRTTDAAARSNEQAFTLQVFEPVRAPAGLVAWWRAENNALDTVGSIPGFLTNGVTFLPGKVGQSFALNGINQCVVIPDVPALRVTSLTFETWVLFDVFSGGNALTVFTKPLGIGRNHSYILRRSGGVLFGAVGDAAGQAEAVSAEFTPISGRWYHLAYAFDDAYDVQALYVDGALAASGTVTKSIGYDTQPVLLGRDTVHGVPGEFLQGRIDEAALYNRALSAGEIASIYNAGPLGKQDLTPLPPIMLSASVEAGVLLISFDAAIGRTYAVLTSDILDATWTVSTNITAVSTHVIYTQSLTNAPQRFYRVSTTEH